MAPIPLNALLPAKPMPPELRAELQYYEENRKYIEAEAQILHRLSGQGQMDSLFQSHSCDFQKLDKIYSQWQPGYDAGHFLYPKEEQNMPVGKNGKPYYTKEQYETARYNSNALEYAQSQGYDLIRQGSYYKLREHDSMVFTPNGSWFWNSRGVHGGALEFMMYYENKTLTEAVLTLAGEREQSNTRPSERKDAPRPETPVPGTLKAVFTPPDKAANFRQLFYYLCNKRGLDKTVVQEMIRQKRVYQGIVKRKDGSIVKFPNGSPVYNAVFPYYDSQLNMVGAYQRGMMDREGQPAYKLDVYGSDNRSGWLLASPFSPATEVRVFEAAIDAASDASLYAMPNMYDGDWRQEPVDRLSLEGLNYEPIQTYLQIHPDVQKVTLMLDADKWGRRAAKEFAERLQRDGFQGEIIINHPDPAFGKDWNDVLRNTKAMLAEAQHEVSQSNAPTPAPEPAPEI